MTEVLKGKSAVITGGGGQIGKEIALAMGREGVKVVVNDPGIGPGGAEPDHAPADEVVAEIIEAGGIAIANYDSVADFAAAENIINTCVNNFDRIDILVNCAGGGGRGGMGKEFWETSEEAWDSTVAVHLKGTFSTCRHALAFMVKQNWGRIINYSSPAWLGGARPGAYAASKGAIVSLTRAIALQMQLEGYAITCNAISPIGPQGLGSRYRQGPPPRMDYWERLYEAGLITQENYVETCVIRPRIEDMSPMILYLSTDEAANINGRMFGTTRGRIALYSEPGEIKGLYKKDPWTLEELVELVPRTLAQDLVQARG